VGGKPAQDNIRLVDHASSQAAARLANQANVEKRAVGTQDLASILAEGKDRKTGWTPTREDLNSECLNMMLAGADPYSGALAACFFYLLKNERCLQKLVDEIR